MGSFDVLTVSRRMGCMRPIELNVDDTRFASPWVRVNGTSLRRLELEQANPSLAKMS